MTPLVKPVAPVRERRRAKPKGYVNMVIRPMTAQDTDSDLSFAIIGNPGSPRFEKNMEAFRVRWPVAHFLYIQA
jgi:hypothetical protein